MQKITYLDKIRLFANKYNGIYKEEICEILKDDSCFYKMNYDTSYKLLSILGLNDLEIEISLLELLR